MVPDTPMWQSLLLESPWLVCGGLLLGALIAGGIGQTTGKKLAWLSALGLFGAAVLLFGVSSFVKTDREQVVALTKALLDDTEGAFDRQAFADKLAPDAVLTDDVGKPWLTRGTWLLAFDAGVSRAGVDNHFVQKLAAGAEGDRAVVELDLITRTHAAGPGLHKTQWTLIWEKSDVGSPSGGGGAGGSRGSGGWRLGEMRCLGYNGESPSELLSYLGSPGRAGGGSRGGGIFGF